MAKKGKKKAGSQPPDGDNVQPSSEPQPSTSQTVIAQAVPPSHPPGQQQAQQQTSQAQQPVQKQRKPKQRQKQKKEQPVPPQLAQPPQMHQPPQTRLPPQQSPQDQPPPQQFQQPHFVRHPYSQPAQQTIPGQPIQFRPTPETRPPQQIQPQVQGKRVDRYRESVTPVRDPNLESGRISQGRGKGRRDQKTSRVGPVAGFGRGGPVAGFGRGGPVSQVSPVGPVGPVSQVSPVGAVGPSGPVAKPTTSYREPIATKKEPPKVQPSVSTSVGDSAKQLEQLSFVQRKKGGTVGRRIIVETNHFPLIINNMVEEALHYDVTITPDKPKRLMRMVWEAYRKKYIPNMHPAFDEVKNIYSAREIPDDKCVGEVSISEDSYSKPKDYKVVIKLASRVNLTTLIDYMKQSRLRVNLPQDALQCIDIVLRNAPAVHFVRVGRSYFSPPKNQIIKLGNGLEMWNGFYQSAILGWKPLLNVDVAHKGFPMEMNVIDLICDILNCRPNDLHRNLNIRDLEPVSKHLKGLKVKYEIPGQPASKRAVRVNSFASESAQNARFVFDDGKEVTVKQYYLKEKKYQIQYPNLLCLWVGSKNKKIYYPPELCTVMPGQVTNKKMNDVQTREMVMNAATNSQIRKNKIMHSIDFARHNDDPCAKEFGISVGNKFENIPARVLQPPTLLYKNEVKPTRGIWRIGQFLNGVELRHWTILNLTRRNDSIAQFADVICRVSRQVGMKIAPATLPFETLNLFRNTQPLTEYFSRNKHMELIFVVVPEGDVYNKVKREAELIVGCLTQCIKQKTLFKCLNTMNTSTVNNILLKINSKLNGINHTFANISKPNCLKQPCMIMGADVTHPSPEQKDRPSVAAVAASHDASAFKYNFCWRLQPARKEIIMDLENIVKEQLLFFYRQTNYKPQSIIFFRDGVSEGQFQQVLDAEVQAIRKACTQLEPNYKPPITFLVVQKRHHTRFFPTRKEDSEDKNFNVPAGTCVDTDIIHPTDLEYYLVSHASIQGVARPTKYRMLWDDQNMSEDEIQTLTYYLCHMFARCARSVSYPAPTYYAHLAAFRASIYYDGGKVNLENSMNKENQVKIKEQPMFFV